MKELSIKQAKSCYAGGITAAGYAAIVSGISFLIGIFDGWVRVLKCH